MSDKPDRESPVRAAKAMRGRIGEILMRDWDPIGVQDAPEARDEYDTYADRIVSMLLSENASAEDLARYLIWAETESMGLKGGDPQKRQAGCQRVAEILIGVRDKPRG